MIKLILKYKAYLLIWYAFLLVVHFIIRDQFKPFIFIFNACPLIFIIAYGLFTSLLFYKKKTFCLLLLCFNSLITMYWFNNYHYDNENPEINKSLNTHAILYWNIARPPHLPLDRLYKNMERYNPEIVVLVEARNIPKEDFDAFKIHFPEYTIKQLNGEMVLAVKGTINDTEYRYISEASKYNFVTTTIHNHRITILIPDLLANASKSKRSDLKKVLHIAEDQNIDFIIGDFNTPYESAFLDPFHTHYESFHAYNNGFTATWPTVFPVLEIDQIWLNKRWQPVKLNKKFHFNSDHALLVGEFQIKP
ncbi:endonuclease/exonuclease/phosphatase family protein [Formosa sp. S-31]|uniref:endonuclease/exonuclease/phosphatase family protein n=1 Tax=Formosa sp. S-31 TaxID=2790949 RepID=UPI003EBA44A8